MSLYRRVTPVNGACVVEKKRSCRRYVPLSSSPSSPLRPLIRKLKLKLAQVFLFTRSRCRSLLATKNNLSYPHVGEGATRGSRALLGPSESSGSLGAGSALERMYGARHGPPLPADWLRSLVSDCLKAFPNGHGHAHAFFCPRRRLVKDDDGKLLLWIPERYRYYFKHNIAAWIREGRFDNVPPVANLDIFKEYSGTGWMRNYDRAMKSCDSFD